MNDDPDDRDRRSTCIASKAPGAVLEPVIEPQPEDHRQDERDVQADRSDRRTDQVADERVPPGRHHQQEAERAWTAQTDQSGNAVP